MVAAKYTLTEKEHILLTDVCNEYWTAFGKLVADNLNKVPRNLQDHLLIMLQEHSSVYGSDYGKHMKRPTPDMERIEQVMKRKI